MISAAAPLGQGAAVTSPHWIDAVLCNGLGQLPGGAGRGPTSGRAPGPVFFGPQWALGRAGRGRPRAAAHALATDALEQLSEANAASGTDWALGVRGALARARERRQRGGDALPRAIERLAPSRLRVELPARSSCTASGCAARSDASTRASSLRSAYEMFSHMGVEAFAERARRELLATGETVRRRPEETRGALTPQETQIAQLAREGLQTPRSARGCSSAPGRRSTTCGRSS